MIVTTPSGLLQCLPLKRIYLNLPTLDLALSTTVHDFLSRSSVVNCDAVSNPNFHPFLLPVAALCGVCALLVCLVCGSCFLTLGLRSSCLHTGRSSLCLTIGNTQPQQPQQANQHSLLLTHNPQGIHLHPLTLSTHRSRYSHSYSLVVSIRCQWSCSQASSTDRTTYTRERYSRRVDNWVTA